MNKLQETIYYRTSALNAQVSLQQDDVSEHEQPVAKEGNVGTQNEMITTGLTGTGQENCNIEIQVNNSESENMK